MDANHIIEHIKINKESHLLIYRRKNLKPSDFHFIDGKGYVFEEIYNYKGLKVYIRIINKHLRFSEILELRRDDFIKIKRSQTGINIRFRCDSRKLPHKNILKSDGVEFVCRVFGSLKYLPYSRREKRDDIPALKIQKDSHKTSTVVTPLTNVEWAISHPYSGGLCTPK